MTDSVFFLDDKEYGNNISFREIDLRAGHLHVLSFLSRPNVLLEDLIISADKELPCWTQGNKAYIDLRSPLDRDRFILTLSSPSYGFSFTYLLVICPGRKEEDFIGSYVSISHKRHHVELCEDKTGRVYLGSFLSLKEDVPILRYDFSFQSFERKLLRKKDVTPEGDLVSYTAKRKYDYIKKGFFLTLKKRIQRKDSFYREGESLIGDNQKPEFFKKA